MTETVPVEQLTIFDWDLLMPLLAAALLSGMVGIERELRRKPAGLRTNILIGVGAALFTAMAMELPDSNASSRIIQGIITGVGFIGGGVLIRQSGAIQGTTTAATIWLVTGIGVACGMDLYKLAFNVTVLALIVLWGLGPLDKRLHRVQGNTERDPDD